MKTPSFWTLFVMLPCLLAGCQYEDHFRKPMERSADVVYVVVTATPIPWEHPLPNLNPDRSDGAMIIATALRATSTQTLPPTPTQLPSNTPFHREKQLPSPVPDYAPGQGMAVLTGESPYAISLLPGGWQAYEIGPSANEWGYIVDVTPLRSAPKGAYVESKILPEYFAGRWADVLWVRAPGIEDVLPVSLDLIPTQGWRVAYENYTKLTPGEWTGWGMFDNAEGCGGVLDISPDNADQSGRSAYIQNTRVQPEFPGSWIQVIRVQLSSQANSQNTWLRYYAPGSLGVEQFRKIATLSAGQWNGFVVSRSSARQGYVVEVVPQEDSDNEVAFSVVRPESDGELWNDVLRVFVPEGRPPLEALMRVLAIKVGPEI